LADVVAPEQGWMLRARSVLRRRGVRGVAEAIRRRVFRRRAVCFDACAARVTGKDGLEIGGPSGVFRAGGILPIYPLVRGLDHCNFAESTIWTAASGETLIRDATDLAGVPDARYDFVLASHVLEHIANPIKALGEWRRVLKPAGVVVVIVPERSKTFDHRRPVTTIDHLRADVQGQMTEADTTHVDEVLALHDLSRDPDAGSRDDFERRCRENLRYRALHHHVFDSALAAAALTDAGFHMIATELASPHHIIALAERAR
jgi:SAM-dependent methyltransferase